MALVLIVAVLGLAGAAVVGLIAGSLDEFSNTIPRYRENLGELYHDLNSLLGQWGYVIPLEGVYEQLDPNALIQFLNYMLNGLSGIIGDGLIVFLAVLFILAEVSTLPEKLRSTLKKPDESMAHFQTFITKVIHYLGLKAATSPAHRGLRGGDPVVPGDRLRVPVGGAGLLSQLHSLYRLHSRRGCPAVVLGLIDHGPLVALWTTLGYVAVNIIVGNVIETRWMGEGLNLSSFVVFVSLIFWGWVLGPTGMFLSIPLTMSITIALESNPETRPIARLMRNTPPGAPERGHRAAGDHSRRMRAPAGCSVESPLSPGRVRAPAGSPFRSRSPAQSPGANHREAIRSMGTRSEMPGRSQTAATGPSLPPRARRAPGGPAPGEGRSRRISFSRHGDGDGGRNLILRPGRPPCRSRFR